MRIALRVLGILVLLVVGVGILQLAASESGEVVVLTTKDAEGRSHETRLWVVERGGHQYLRAGGEEQGWYRRLRQDPTVSVERDGGRAAYHATQEPELRAEINGLMEAKYGWGDSVIAIFFPRDRAIPIRLEARD